jgi:hypothetical protein
VTLGEEVGRLCELDVVTFGKNVFEAAAAPAGTVRLEEDELVDAEKPDDAVLLEEDDELVDAEVDEPRPRRI